MGEDGGLDFREKACIKSHIAAAMTLGVDIDNAVLLIIFGSRRCRSIRQDVESGEGICDSTSRPKHFQENKPNHKSKMNVFRITCWLQSQPRRKLLGDR